jgi:hypothetical protein
MSSPSTTSLLSRATETGVVGEFRIQCNVASEEYTRQSQHGSHCTMPLSCAFFMDMCQRRRGEHLQLLDICCDPLLFIFLSHQTLWYSSCLLCSKCSCVAHVCHTHIVAPNVTRKMKESRTSRSLQLNIVCHGYE